MPKVFFAREGTDQNRSSQGIYIDMKAILQHFGETETKYFPGAPLINENKNPSPYSAYTLTVVDVEEDETNEKFPKTGFYWLCQVDPKDCAKLLNLHLGR